MQKVKRYSWLLSLLLLALACQTFSPSPTATANPPSPTPLPLDPTATPTALVPTEEPVQVDWDKGSIGDPFAPELGNLGYDVQRYSIQVFIDPAQRYILDATVQIDARSTQDDLEDISLDFIGFEISELTVDGAQAEYIRQADKLIVTLPESKTQGQDFTVQVSYSGRATVRRSRYVPFIDHIGLLYPDDQSMFIASEPDGARFWFPCNDHPRDKAAFRIEVTVPRPYTAVSNGLLLDTESLPDNQRRFIWEHDFPMATYLATIAVGDYQRVQSQAPDGVLLRDYVFPDYADTAGRAFENAGEALAWLSDMLGPYPFEAYGHVTVNESGFSMETQTMVLMAVFMLQENVMVHEMTHMWFGDWVSLDSWGEMWRNEGFADYFEWMWESRDDPARFEQQMENLTLEVQGLDYLEPLNDLSPGNLFGYETYIKGAVVAHALRQEMGDEAFFAGLRLYFERFGGGTASDAEFKAVMEEAYGASLDDFFASWFPEN